MKQEQKSSYSDNYTKVVNYADDLYKRGELVTVNRVCEALSIDFIEVHSYLCQAGYVELYECIMVKDEAHP